MWRNLKPHDISRLKYIHDKAGYGFDFPKFGTMESAITIEEKGVVVGALGCELEAQIYGVFDPEWGSPHRRMELYGQLHAPIHQQLVMRGVKTANVFLDPKYKRFGQRMLDMGWEKALWDCYCRKV